MEAAGNPRIMPTEHEDGYPRVYIGKGHPYATSGGWQYLHRWIMMREVGRVLDTYEHVHHNGENGNRDKRTRDVRELEILEDVDHGHYHYGERLGCGKEFCTYSHHRSPDLNPDGSPSPYRQN
jgi:hypothetical protein